MKKLLVIIAVLAFVLAGCGNTESSEIYEIYQYIADGKTYSPAAYAVHTRDDTMNGTMPAAYPQIILGHDGTGSVYTETKDGVTSGRGFDYTETDDVVEISRLADDETPVIFDGKKESRDDGDYFVSTLKKDGDLLTVEGTDATLVFRKKSGPTGYIYAASDTETEGIVSQYSFRNDMKVDLYDDNGQEEFHDNPYKVEEENGKINVTIEYTDDNLKKMEEKGYEPVTEFTYTEDQMKAGNEKFSVIGICAPYSEDETSDEVTGTVWKKDNYTLTLKEDNVCVLETGDRKIKGDYYLYGEEGVIEDADSNKYYFSYADDVIKLEYEKQNINLTESR